MSDKYIAEVNFPDGTNFKFASEERIVDWAQSELIAWSPIFSIQQNSLEFQDERESFSRLLGGVKEGLSQIVSGDLQTKKRNLAQLSRYYVSSKGSIGKKILEASTNPRYALLLYASTSASFSNFARSIFVAGSHGFNESRERQALEWLRAHLDIYSVRNGIKGSISSDRRAFEGLRNSADQLISDYTERLRMAEEEYSRKTADFSVLQEDCTSNAQALFESLKQEVEGIKTFYKNELGLQIPVTYWSDKAKEHRFLLRMWSGIFTAAVISLCAAAPTIFKYTLAAVTDALSSFSEQSSAVNLMGMAPWLFFVAVSFPLFLSIWLLRLVAKTLLSHQHQMNDASLRVVMTTTFLALINDNKADEKDRILILNALFHVPSNVNEDGSPPHWFEILQSRLRSGA